MVEKEEGYAVVNAMAMDSSSSTVGAAIDILEAKLAKKGIRLQFPTVASKSDKGRVDGKLLRLPTLIHLAMTHGIETSESGSEESVGEQVTGSVQETLVPGNVVALYDDSLSFLRVLNDKVDSFGYKEITELPLDWDSERFLVVDAGNGNVALYSPSHRLFLGCKNGHLDVAGYPIFKTNESPRANECFQIVACQDDPSKFSLRCLVDAASACLAVTANDDDDEEDEESDDDSDSDDDEENDGTAVLRAVQIYGFD